MRIELSVQSGKISRVRCVERDCGVVAPNGRRVDPYSVLDVVFNQATDPEFFGVAWVEVDLFGDSIKDVRKCVDRIFKVDGARLV